MNRYEFAQILQGLDVVAAQKKLNSFTQYTVKDRLKSIVDYHIAHNPLYKEKIAGLCIQNFEDLPIVRKSDFQKPLEKLISDE